MKKQIYSFLLVLIGVFAYAVPVCAQENNDEPEDALEKAEAKKFRGLDYEVPELSSKLKDMADDYLLSVKNADNAKASRQLVVLMDTIMKKPFRQRVDGLVSVGHYFVQNRSEKAAVLFRDKIVEMDKAPTMRYTLLFCAEVSELVEDYGNAANFYDEVNYLDENDLLAFNRKAYLNKFIRQDFAIENYKKLLTLNPGEYNAYKHIGDIYYSRSTHETYGPWKDSLRAEAIDSYKKYFDAAPREEGSLEYRACQRYVFTMWERQLDPRHKENDSLRAVLRNNAREIAQLALDLKVAPDMYQQRLMHYYIFSSDLFNGNYELARQSRSYVTSKQFPDSIYKFNDYFYAAQLELWQKKYEEAIPFYEQIVANIPDSTIKIYNNIIDVYNDSLKLPSKAIPYKEKHMALRGDKRMPQEDVKYVQLINAAMKLASDSAEVDSLNKKLAVVSDTYLPNHTQKLAVDSVKENKGLTLLLLSGIKDLYAELQRGEEGIPYFTQYLEIMGDSATWRDQMSLADLYQKISRTDSINQMMYIEKADSLYEQIAVAMENGKLDGYTKELVVYMPWFQRAQLWILNPQEAEEKPKTYYEKALELLPESSMFDARRKICAQYLMVYYFKTDNDDECMKYLEQVLILDPNNRIANQILEVLM